MSQGEPSDESDVPARSWDPAGIGRWQRPVKAVLRPLFKRLWNFEVTGLEHVPVSGPAVLCPNHIAAIDSFFLPAVLPRAITYVGKAEYLDDWKTRTLFPALGMIPIDRRGGDHSAGALGAARSVLETGNLFGIYPEGTRSRSGMLHKGHTGAARLAIETGAPILPVGLVGTAEIQPPDTSMPKFFRDVTIRIGRPIDVARYANRVGDRAVYRELIDEVMFEIQALCGQEYSNTYAGSAAAEPATTAPAPAAAPTPEIVVVGDPTIPRLSSTAVLRPRPLAEAV